MQLGFVIEELADIESVFLIIVCCQFEVGMLCQIVLVGEKGSDTTQLKDTLSTIQDCQLILRHEFMPQLLEVGAIGRAIATGIRCVEAVDCLGSDWL